MVGQAGNKGLHGERASRVAWAPRQCPTPCRLSPLSLHFAFGPNLRYIVGEAAEAEAWNNVTV